MITNGTNVLMINTYNMSNIKRIHVVEAKRRFSNREVSLGSHALENSLKLRPKALFTLAVKMLLVMFIRLTSIEWQKN